MICITNQRENDGLRWWRGGGGEYYEGRGEIGGKGESSHIIGKKT